MGSLLVRMGGDWLSVTKRAGVESEQIGIGAPAGDGVREDRDDVGLVEWTEETRAGLGGRDASAVRGERIGKGSGSEDMLGVESG